MGFGPRSVAISERCLKMARDFANSRVTFGKPLADRQAIQWMLADSAIAIESLRWMTYHAAWKLDQKQDARTEVSMVKVFASETLERIADRAYRYMALWESPRIYPLNASTGEPGPTGLSMVLTRSTGL